MHVLHIFRVCHKHNSFSTALYSLHILVAKGSMLWSMLATLLSQSIPQPVRLTPILDSPVGLPRS